MNSNIVEPMNIIEKFKVKCLLAREIGIWVYPKIKIDFKIKIGIKKIRCKT